MEPSPIEPIHRPGIRAWIDTSSPFASVLESRLEEIASVPSRFTPIRTRSRSRRLWEGSLDGIPCSLILKQRWLNPSYGLSRRISCRVSLALENPFRQALEIAPRLAATGIAAIRPVLCWKRFSHHVPVEEGILYPRFESSMSLHHYLVGHPCGPSRVTTLQVHLPRETLSALGRFLRALNAAGFVHVDPAPHNILVRAGAPLPPTETSFALIDVEAFRPLPSSRPDSPGSRYARAMAVSPLLPYLPPDDLAPFGEAFALDSESPAAWLRVFVWLRRHPNPRPLSRFRLFLRTLAFRPQT